MSRNNAPFSTYKVTDEFSLTDAKLAFCTFGMASKSHFTHI